MLAHYLKIAIRSLLKNKLYFFLNLFGLVFGLTSGMLLFFYVQQERSFDRFHENSPHIYRILQSFRNGDSYTTTSLSPYKFAPLLTDYHSGVEKFVRIDNTVGARQVSFENNKYQEDRITFVDTTFFDVFSFELIKGNPQTALREPNTVVITQAMADKYFGREEPLGKTLEFKNTFNNTSFNARVTGITHIPANSHFHRDFFISMKTGDVVTPGKINSWGWTSQYAYLLTSPETKPEDLEAAAKEVAAKHAPDWFPEWAYFTFQPLEEAHLHSTGIKDEMEAQGDANYLRIFSIVFVFILLIAGINYMNLATARSMERAKEVGLRKVVGAQRTHLIFQFMAEAVILSLAAFGITVLILQTVPPLFQRFTGAAIEINLFTQPQSLLLLLGIALSIGIFSGSYPAFVISGFQPLRALNKAFSNMRLDMQSLFLRKGLVVFQFALSIILIVSTLVIYQQWEYLKNKKLGVAADRIITIPVVSQRSIDAFTSLQEEWKQIPGVEKVSAYSKPFTSVHSNFNTFYYNEEKYSFPVIGITEDFFEAFDVPFLEGRSFQKGRAADTATVIMNRAAWESMGDHELLGQAVQFGNPDDPQPAQVIGIVEDFHFEPLYRKLNPVLFYVTQNNFSEIALRLNTKDPTATLQQLESSWKNAGMEEAFNYQFLDEDVQALYQKEAVFFKVFSLFTGLAIFIACLGLFGLASYTAQRRTKEIGIRKVVGASLLDVIYLLNRDLFYLILLAFIIASPVAWWGMHQWLENFAYSTSIRWTLFLIAGGLITLIAIITVSWQSLRAAQTNPVKALRYE